MNSSQCLRTLGAICLFSLFGLKLLIRWEFQQFKLLIGQNELENVNEWHRSSLLLTGDKETFLYQGSAVEKYGGVYVPQKKVLREKNAKCVLMDCSQCGCADSCNDVVRPRMCLRDCRKNCECECVQMNEQMITTSTTYSVKVLTPPLGYKQTGMNPITFEKATDEHKLAWGIDYVKTYIITIRPTQNGNVDIRKQSKFLPKQVQLRVP